MLGAVEMGVFTKWARGPEGFDAVPDGAAFIVCEAMTDDEPKADAFGLPMRLNRLIETPGGFRCAGADCKDWMREAEFSSARVERPVGPGSMVIGIE